MNLIGLPEENECALPISQFHKLVAAFSLRKERQTLQEIIRIEKIIPPSPDSKGDPAITPEMQTLMHQTYDLLVGLEEGLPVQLLSPITEENAMNLRMLEVFLRIGMTKGRLSKMLVLQHDAIQVALEDMLYCYSQTLESGMTGHWQSLLGGPESEQVMQSIVAKVQQKLEDMHVLSKKARLLLHKESEPAWDVPQDVRITGLAAWLSLWGIDRVSLADGANGIKLSMTPPFFHTPLQQIQRNLELLRAAPCHGIILPVTHLFDASL